MPVETGEFEAQVGIFQAVANELNGRFDGRGLIWRMEPASMVSSVNEFSPNQPVLRPETILFANDSEINTLLSFADRKLRNSGIIYDSGFINLEHVSDTKIANTLAQILANGVADPEAEYYIRDRLDYHKDRIEVHTLEGKTFRPYIMIEEPGKVPTAASTITDLLYPIAEAIVGLSKRQKNWSHRLITIDELQKQKERS